MSLKSFDANLSASGLSVFKNMYKQRVILEASLESSTKESKYSNELIELMKCEEKLISDPNAGGSHLDVSRQVEDGLKAETSMFFHHCSQQNIKKWRNLQSRIKNELSNYNLSHDSKSSKNEIMNTSGNHTAIDLDLEERKMEEYYNANWLDIEKFHLQEAFKTQSARIESEWAAYEVSELQEYHKQRSRATGVMIPTIPNISNEKDLNSNRWQHPEKQKTLIHTAPVLSPRMNVDKSSSPRNKHFSSEIERVELKHVEAIDSLNKQKFASKKWMARQQLRLVCQASEVAIERKIIAELIRDELEIYLNWTLEKI